ncbi:PAS domain S-box-containing protein [Halobiforma haloterrestris]|uniref:histidine kinase n=1 Tax=Natronobacterium haloterrestre TaxID=148448 RepID=A0A1I1D5F4_NATHA|nr:PAS domain S-box protein [Halobiforma haloterrestris]SFB69612.1 PAS domain S-box-containing protein [Halobiforma haloterrestris]
MTGRTRVVFADDTPPEGLESPLDDGTDDTDTIDGAVTTVVDGVRDCLEALPSADCVVVAGLPETDPVDLCERIRDRRPNVPIVAFPTDGSEALAGELVAAGVDGYVPRSQGLDTLSRRIRELVSPGPGSSADGDPKTRDADTERDGTEGAPVTATNTIETLESAMALDPEYAGADDRSDPSSSSSSSSSSSPSSTDDGAGSIRVDEALDRFFEGIPLAVVEWNREFEAVGWSATATGLFGYSAEEALGTSAFELLIPESERDTAREYWSELVDQQYGRGPSTRINRNVCADGSTIVCEWVNTPIFDGDEVVGILSYARDVSEEHKRANALEALQVTTHELIRAESAERIAEIVIDATETVLEQPLGTIRLYDEEAGHLELEGATSELEAVAADVPPVEPGDSDFWTAYADGESIVLTDVSSDGIPVEFEPDAAVSLGNAILHPVGEHGLLTIASSGEDRLDPTDIHLVRVLAATVEAALDRTVRTRELARTETIVEAVGDGVYALDADGRFVTVNDRLAAVTGYDRDDLLGSHVSTILTDESDARRRKRVRALSSVGEDGIATYEATLEASDGETVPCEINTTLWRPEGGDGPDDSVRSAAADRTGTVGIVRDVTDRKRMQREIIDQKAKIESLHAIASRLDDCEDGDEVCELAVEAAEDVLNFDACAVYLADEDDDSLVKRALSSEFDDQYERRIPLDRGIAGKTYRNEQTYRIEDVGERDDAHPATERFRSALSVPIGDRGVFQAASTEYDAFDDDDKELAELLLSHVSDALERLAFEAELRTERDRFAALFENVPDAVVSSRYVDEGAQPIVEAVNPAFERVFGYEESELIGESIDDYIVPSDRGDEAERINRTGSQGDTVEMEVKRRTTDGLRDFMLRLAPMETDGYSERTFGVYTDITERKQHRKRVEILNRVLRHDLRNGMNIIDGCAQLLLEELQSLESDPEVELDVDGCEHARAIQERANELIELAEKTRGVERTLERGDSAASRIDLADLVSDAVGRLEREYPHAEVTTSVPDCTARGTEFLETALFQVLENAVEHNDTPQPSIEVTVADAAEDGMVRVSVADDGPGIPAEERELLQEDREITQLRHASGLGLWLVNWVVTHSGGRLSFSENGSRGAVVTIELPRAEFDGDVECGNGERDRGRRRGRDRGLETDSGT